MRIVVSRTRVLGTLTVGSLAFAASVAGAGSALAADNSPGFGGRDIVRGNAEYRFAERTAPAQINGTGPKDMFVGVPFSDADGKKDSGRVFAMDGNSLTADPGTELHEISPPGGAQQEARFGFFISVPGDLVGNGVADLVVGADGQDVDIDGDGTEESDVGKAWVFDGADGTMAFALTNPNPQANQTFGERIGRAGDVNGDGVPDILVGAPDTNIDINGDGTPESNVGQAYVLSGADGTEIFTINTPDPQADAKFGLAIQGPGDLGSMAAGDPSTTQDGTIDLFVNAALFDLPGLSTSNEGRSYVFSGQDVNGDGVLDGSELLTRVDSPQPQDFAFFGFQDVKPLSPGDVNGDGYLDLYGNGFNQDVGSNTNQGRAWVFDGQASVAQTGNGVVLHQLDDPDSDNHGRFGWSMTKADHNGGAPDMYIGQAPHPHAGEVAAGEGTGGSYIFDGGTAGLLQTLDLPTPECDQGVSDSDPGPALGWTTSAPGDLDGDGRPDYVAGGPHTNVNMDGTRQEDAGSLVSFNSGLADNIDQCSSE